VIADARAAETAQTLAYEVERAMVAAASEENVP
jgi:hypothetical protein